MIILSKLADYGVIVAAELAAEPGRQTTATQLALSTQLPQNFPQIRALVWFNESHNKNGTVYPWQIESSSSAQTAFSNGIKSSYYKAGGSFANLPLLSKIKPL